MKRKSNFDDVEYLAILVEKMKYDYQKKRGNK